MSPHLIPKSIDSRNVNRKRPWVDCTHFRILRIDSQRQGIVISSVSGEPKLVEMTSPDSFVDKQERRAVKYCRYGRERQERLRHCRLYPVYPAVTMNGYSIQPTGAINHRSHGLVWLARGPLYTGTAAPPPPHVRAGGGCTVSPHMRAGAGSR